MRLFIAVDFPDNVKQALYEVAVELARQADVGRVVPLENFHLTLTFIGETERVQEIAELMRVSVSRFAGPLRLSLKGIGSFKAKAGKGHNWWVGVEPNPSLASLARYLTDALTEAGFAIERRNFKPHVTLARSIKTSRPIELELPKLEVRADALSLMRSDHKAGRQVYTELLSVSLL